MISVETEFAGPVIVSTFIPTVDYDANETLPNLLALVLGVVLPRTVTVNAYDGDDSWVAILGGFYNGAYLIGFTKSVDNEMAEPAIGA
jgi:hypothetical protein